MTFEQLQPGARVQGLLPNHVVTIIQVTLFGSGAASVVHKTNDGHISERVVYTDDLSALELVESGRAWAFDGDGASFKLAAEAYRIKLAHLFDPILAVHSSNVEPLPHQITAVYESMLPRQPLRFLLADDPGAGKTIMAGLLIKELIARGDLKRCLIVCPGSLATQWQDELTNRFDLHFQILTNEGIESAVTGNWFMENDLSIARLDKLARNEEIQKKLTTENNYYDLVIFDEAHKLSATFFGGEAKYTKRFRLAEKVSHKTRHFLLMTATPHNGKEEDFQLFLSLLDGDRFEGKHREGVHQIDTSDLMRRMVKEDLLKFDKTRLFPPRIAYSREFELSPLETRLYAEVTEYVRDEFNRAEALQNEKRAGTVGFALTILQRRLASSPEAIYQSIYRRRIRLTEKLKEAELINRGMQVHLPHSPTLDNEDLEDLEDAPEVEMEQTEAKVLDQATAAQTIEELRKEIARLGDLEKLAAELRRSAEDTKWVQLSQVFDLTLRPTDIIGEVEEMPHGGGSIPPPRASRHQKLVVFTEHRDTLNYLQQRIGTLLGPKAVQMIHGGVGREDRVKAQEKFLFDPDVRVLLATDAAGEGINLQRAHLMINYDLPWNPNRLEQRFGRIHRIGQTEICYLWNLVARNTREGEVYLRLLQKLEDARASLGGKVFDVLGQLQFDGRPLRQLLIDAIRYGERPDVRDKIRQQVDNGGDLERLKDLLRDNALSQDIMDTSRVDGIRQAMELAEARKLQPFYVRQFFMEAFAKLGGSMHEREKGRYEIKRVPASVRYRDRVIGRSMPVLDKYERAVFEKKLIHVEGKIRGAFITPNHPLMQSVIDLTLERHRNLLKQGAILVDENDMGTSPRMLLFVQHSIKDASVLPNGDNRTISQRILYVEIDEQHRATAMSYAPYLDYRPLCASDPSIEVLLQREEFGFVRRDLEQIALEFAIRELVPTHLAEVRTPKLEWIEKTKAAVKLRLLSEINYWDHRAMELEQRERAGRAPGNLNSTQARNRANELQGRLQKRIEDLDKEAQIAPATPLVVGGIAVLPLGLLHRINGVDPEEIQHARDTQASAARAREIVMRIESEMGCIPKDVEFERRGYDIESLNPQTNEYRLIEVKGRVTGASDITFTKNEILTGLNAPDHYLLAMVEFLDPDNHRVHYLRQPFADAGLTRDFNATSVNLPFNGLLSRSIPPFL